jgi:TolA-binding protein
MIRNRCRPAECPDRLLATMVLAGLLGMCGCASGGSSSPVADEIAGIRIGVDQARAQQERLHRALESLTAPPRVQAGPQAQAVPEDQPPTAPARTAQRSALNPAEAEVLYRQGYALFHRGDYAAAEQALRAYLQVRPASPHADQGLFWLGESLLAAGKQSDAVQVFETLLSRFPASDRAPVARDRIAAAPAPHR